MKARGRIGLTRLHDGFERLGTHQNIGAFHVLLRAGEVATSLYLIEQGCARLYVVDVNGRETSTQFFFEGDVVSSIESFLTGRPSSLCLETLEPARLRVLHKAVLKTHVAKDSELQAELQALLEQRLIHYANLYTSAIADTPTQRYVALLNTHQHLLARVPLHILAAYLGVSAVHLSRIRRKLRETSSL